MGKTIVAIPLTKVVVVVVVDIMSVVDIMVVEDTIRWPIDEEACVKQFNRRFNLWRKTVTSDKTHSSYLSVNAMAGR